MIRSELVTEALKRRGTASTMGSFYDRAFIRAIG